MRYSSPEEQVGAWDLFYVASCLLGLLSLVVWGGARMVAAVRFDSGCTQHIARAAKANSIELAGQELTAVLSYLRQHRMTEGYTSVLYKSPGDDVGFWYKNLDAALKQLEEEPPNASMLEKNSVLQRVQKNLTDEGEPSGISVFPHNARDWWWGWLSLAAAVFGFIKAVRAAWRIELPPDKVAPDVVLRRGRRRSPRRPTDD